VDFYSTIERRRKGEILVRLPSYAESSFGISNNGEGTQGQLSGGGKKKGTLLFKLMRRGSIAGKPFLLNIERKFGGWEGGGNFL